MSTKIQNLVNNIEKQLYKINLCNNIYNKNNDKTLKKLRLRYLNSGCSRAVFTSKDFSNIVIKIQLDNSAKYNLKEYSAYKNASEEEKLLLARPIAISTNGSVLASLKVTIKDFRLSSRKLCNFLKKLEKSIIGKKVNDRYSLSEFYSDRSYYGKFSKTHTHNIGYDNKTRQYKLYDYPVG